MKDPRFPPNIEFPTLWRVVRHATGTEIHSEITEDLKKTYLKASQAIKEIKQWTGPNGLRYVPVLDGRSGTQIVGYQALRPGDWFILHPDGSSEGPLKTKRQCLKLLGVKRARKIEPGHYQATEDTKVLTRSTLDKLAKSPKKP